MQGKPVFACDSVQKGKAVMKFSTTGMLAALAACSMLLFASCSTQPEPVSSEISTVSSQVESTVEITIPGDYYNGMTLEEVKGSAKKQGIDKVTQEKDGSYTFEMTASAHRRLVSEMRFTLKDNISALAGTEEYPSVKSASLSDDLSELTLMVDQKAYSSGNDQTIARTVWPSVCAFYYFNLEDPAGKTLSVLVLSEEDSSVIEEFQWPEPAESKAESGDANADSEKK